MHPFFKGFIFAFQGIKTAFLEQRNLRFHSAAALIVIAAGFIFEITKTEWLIALLCIAMVIGMELLNTAVEYLTDLASPEIHPLAKKAKDVAAAAVLFVSIIAAIIGLIIFLPYIQSL